MLEVISVNANAVMKANERRKNNNLRVASLTECETESHILPKLTKEYWNMDTIMALKIPNIPKYKIKAFFCFKFTLPHNSYN